MQSDNFVRKNLKRRGLTRISRKSAIKHKIVKQRNFHDAFLRKNDADKQKEDFHPNNTLTKYGLDSLDLTLQELESQEKNEVRNVLGTNKKKNLS